jgi:hypothetical protein
VMTAIIASPTVSSFPYSTKHIYACNQNDKIMLSHKARHITSKFKIIATHRIPTVTG